MSEYCDSRPFCDDRIDELREAAATIASLTAENERWAAELDIARDEIERLRGVIEDAIETLEAMDLHVDNPLYERLCAALHQQLDR